MSWEQLPAIERANYPRTISAKLRQHRTELADIMVREQGKVRGLAKVEVDFTADYIDYMAEWARRLEGEVLTSDRPKETVLLLRKPIGVVAGILPWNFPFFLIARKMAPALVTGNTIVIKPSEETPVNAFIFAELVAETDLPPGTGTRIMQMAAENLTRVNLELGGKAPAIVLADAEASAPLAPVPFKWRMEFLSRAFGLQAAEAFGEESARVLKTLMTLVDGKPLCLLVPSDKEFP